jgi:hypothetical protein
MLELPYRDEGYEARLLEGRPLLLPIDRRLQEGLLSLLADEAITAKRVSDLMRWAYCKGYANVLRGIKMGFLAFPSQGAPFRLYGENRIDFAPADAVSEVSIDLGLRSLWDEFAAIRNWTYKDADLVLRCACSLGGRSAIMDTDPYWFHKRPPKHL